MENEKIFYQEPNILITNSRIVVNGKTYAMRNISSVGMSENPKLFLKIASTIMLIFGMAGMYLKDYWMGTAALGIAIIILLNSRNEYAVVISSNSGDSNALSSNNKDYILSVVNAINEAIVYRG
tara:strand:+ start:169 stop:540 length:372 start_codon:yes stop_codon:yes gene_type:complete